MHSQVNVKISQSYSPTYHITLYNDAQHELKEFSAHCIRSRTFQIKVQLLPPGTSVKFIRWKSGKENI